MADLSDSFSSSDEVDSWLDDEILGGWDVEDGSSDSKDPIVSPPTPLHDPASSQINPRAYQLEMLAESLKQNIIVAMDTGSGKTQVAVMRIREELETGDPNKIIWFLARTVALCSQQHNVIKSQLPVAQTRLLLGVDNIDAWSDQETWDTILLNTRIVVSTPQILHDALTHGFITMQRLSLLVFDEAHHCVKNDVGKQIMEKFYHNSKQAGLPIPHILGLTASPVMGSRLDGIETLERVLDAVCKGPTLHRGELLSHVKKPTLELAYYESKSESVDIPRSILSLRGAFRSLDIQEDPYVKYLLGQGTDRSRRKLERVLERWDTYTQNQIRTFTQRSSQLLRELGSWAAEYYVWKVIEDAKSALVSRESDFVSWTDEEKQYLAKCLGQVEPVLRTEADLTREAVSDKVVLLMENLLLHGDDDTLGIVFVKERTTATVLAHLLASHPLTRHRYPRVGVVVGISQFAAKRKDIWDLSRTEEFQSLQRFRNGEVNLLVATNVLEEGIDVPACNLVVCFDQPDNLKSFIQRRGRARQRDSRLVILVDIKNPPKALGSWEEMEAQMKLRYEDQDREIQRLQEIEDSEPTPSEKLVVESTGAWIDYDTAKSHLEHFCAKLSPGRYVDSQPDFIIRKLDDGDSPLLRAIVLLPSYVPEAVRTAESRNAWLTEKNAIKDAAFQAYAALYNAKLLNDHLLPLKAQDMIPGLEHRPRELVPINSLVNPWIEVARAWENGGEVLWAIPIRFRDPHGICRGSYTMIAPLTLPELPPAVMYVERDNSHWTVEFGAQQPVLSPSTADHASVLLALPFSHRWPFEDRHHVLRFICDEGNLTIDQLGAKPFDVDDFTHQDSEYLVRDCAGCPYRYEKILSDKPSRDQVQKVFRPYGDTPGFDDAPSDVPYLALKKSSRRIDFLHRQTGDPAQEKATTKPYSRVFPLPWARVDLIPSRHALFGTCIPSILHHVEVRLVAKLLSCSVIRDLSMSDLSLVVGAISSRSAREPVDYERLEFVGDSLLKLCATINVAALRLDWPEGYLSAMKDGLVSNSRLCKAALDRGLDKFLLTRPFTGSKWRPLYVDALLDGDAADSGPREVSSKMLADVVEALIGAAHADGGVPKALACIALFLPDIEWHPPDDCRQTLYDHAPSDVPLPPTLAPLEDLLGYQFRKKALLLEATTHASYRGLDGVPLRTLDRLEFMGDAVLDYIVVSRLYPLNLPTSAMHLLKTCAVNGDLLGFLALEHHVNQDRVVISKSGENSPIAPESPPSSPQPSTPDAGATAMETEDSVNIDAASTKKPILKHETFPLPLWKFLRHTSPAIVVEQPYLDGRHAALRSRILTALRTGTHYPWALLARLRTPKFVSDHFEAVLGAVWVDSGDMSACEAVAARFGILGVLDRLIQDGVHVLHPKEELGRLADSEKVEYIVEAVDESGDEENGAVDENEGDPGALPFGKMNWQCRIMLGTRCLIEMDGGVSREEVETKAAEVAVRVLVEERKQRAASDAGVGMSG
ncbi:hypothetical protein ACRALDRAFT_1074287 [Sodiomyces alcalophilus JCM 7366]|uniref:uncharacterized protein n=1 Tax=Sodiomyces alcalophilus JCM 7366 TaxID=591952 RepID=UPI0039B3B3B4